LRSEVISASSTEVLHVLADDSLGPDSVVMNPIFTFCCASTGPETTSAAAMPAEERVGIFASWLLSSRF